MKKVIIDKERCKSCGLCVNVCPKKILEIADSVLNSKGYSPAQVIDCEQCIGCAFCAAVCPDVAIRIENEEQESHE